MADGKELVLVGRLESVARPTVCLLIGQRMWQIPRYTLLHPRLCPRCSYFFTVALLERYRHFLTEHIDALRTTFISVRRQRPFHIDATVMFPDHLHCLLTTYQFLMTGQIR